MRQVTSDKEYITNSALETRNVAKGFVANLKGGAVLALSGDLGSGKTTFVQGLAEAMGVKERANSPTFVIVKQHKCKMQNAILYLYHVDMYRVKSIEDAISAGIMDYLGQPDTICVIEWAERVRKLLPNETIWIKFEHVNQDKRRIKFPIPKFPISN